MLTKCPECELPVSDKATTCPHCGYPLKKSSNRNYRPKNHMRLPNGFGQITEIKRRNLRNPFRVMVPAGKDENGRPISRILKPKGYFATYNEAYQALCDYHKNPYDLENIITVKELYERWSKEYFAKLTSQSSIRTITSAWAYCKNIYDMQVRDVRSRHIKACMDATDSENIKSRIKSVFNLMLDYAVEYEIVDKNYARDFKAETSHKNIKDHVSFTDDEMTKLWSYTQTPFVNVILIQCYTGWRPQELCNIKLSDVNIQEWTMTGGMKTEAGANRVVPIIPKIQPLVKKIYDLSVMLGSEYFVCDNDGKHLSYDRFYKKFKANIQDLGLSDDHRPHDPRKHFITIAKASAVDEYAIKRLVGHSINDLTERVYTDRDLEWLRKEISRISL